MSEYFDRTLQVNREVLKRPDVLERLVQDYAALYWGADRGDALDRKIGEGQTRWVFSVGQLSNGLWLAHKVYIGSRVGGPWTLENECQKAEQYFEERDNVPFFSMITKHDGIGSILTEDITHGGELKIYDDEHVFVWMQPKKGKGGRMKMYTDFKHSGRLPFSTDYDYKYSSEEAVLIV